MKKAPMAHFESGTVGLPHATGRKAKGGNREPNKLAVTFATAQYPAYYSLPAQKAQIAKGRGRAR
jgi:hypothetical protein